MGFWWAQDTVWVSWHMMMSLLLNTGEEGMLLLLGAPAAEQRAECSGQQDAALRPEVCAQHHPERPKSARDQIRDASGLKSGRTRAWSYKELNAQQQLQLLKQSTFERAGVVGGEPARSRGWDWVGFEVLPTQTVVGYNKKKNRASVSNTQLSSRAPCWEPAPYNFGRTDR